MLTNSEVELYFKDLSAHSDVSEEFLASLKKLGEYELCGTSKEFAAPYIVTENTIFCAAAGMSETYWRLRPSDIAIALATGAEPAAVGSEWVVITLFRSNWPKPDLAYWALRSYDFARTGK
jgi:hypothetical protein